MGYLITQIVICLLTAAIIGFIMGWFLKGLIVNKIEEDVEGEANSFSRDIVDDEMAIDDESISLTESEIETGEMIPQPFTIAPSIAHKIERIEGIEKNMIKILKKDGIKTTRDLLDKCEKNQGIEKIVGMTGAEELVVKQWVSMADLMRIPDVNGKIAKLITACGIKSTKALTAVDAQALVNEMENVNKRELLVEESTPLPDAEKMAFFIREATTL